MSELDQEALFHRSLNDRTDWTANLPYDVGALPERYSDAFRRAGAQTAYTVASNGLVPILFKLKKEQDFAKYATRWENDHSKLIHGHGAGRVFPVVNEDMTVIGHYGTFSNYEVYAPIDGTFDLDAKVTQGKVLVERGATSAHIDEDLMTVKDTLDQAFRRQRDRELQRQGYIPNQAAKPETYYTVITDPGRLRAHGDRGRDERGNPTFFGQYRGPDRHPAAGPSDRPRNCQTDHSLCRA